MIVTLKLKNGSTVHYPNVDAWCDDDPDSVTLFLEDKPDMISHPWDTVDEFTMTVKVKHGEVDK